MNLIEREYYDLQSHRVALRQRRDRLMFERSCSPQNRYGPDGYDNAIVSVEAALRGTERRWQELCILLRKPLPAPPVKIPRAVRITTPARPRSATIRSAGPVYLNRALGSR